MRFLFLFFVDEEEYMPNEWKAEVFTAQSVYLRESLRIRCCCGRPLSSSGIGIDCQPVTSGSIIPFGPPIIGYACTDSTGIEPRLEK